MLKILLGVSILGLVALGFVGNYFYDLALNPATDKSIVFDNEETSNENDYDSESSFFEDVPYTDVIIENDSLALHAYDFNQNSDVYVIVVHGYTSEGSSMQLRSEHFYNLGYNVLTVDLRGHGLSDGDYIGMGWDDRFDIIAWIDYLVEKDSDTSIVLYGVSMGAATVLNTTGEELPTNVVAAIEDCGYTTTWDIFKYQLGSIFSLPAHPFMDAAKTVTLVRAGYDIGKGPIDLIANSVTPTLFIHGDQDLFVPYEMLDILYTASNAPKEKLVISGAGHGQSDLVDPDTYWATVDAFISKYLP
ncbi:MAG: alpha/beta hydrolase [Anaerorhabdus sp.]